MSSEIEMIAKVNEHMLAVIDIVKQIHKRLNEVEGVKKMNTEGLDLQQLTEEVSRSIKDDVVSEVASCIDLSVVADEIDRDEISNDVAQYFGERGIADAVADSIDMRDVIQGVVDLIDYKKLAQAIVISFLADKKIEEDK
tara:strand:- start:45 stop:464 length:420 start_codon:yes stop_codon:yes gene_type:complete